MGFNKLIPAEVVSHIRNAMEFSDRPEQGLSAEQRLEQHIQLMSPREMFETWCNYEGIINYGDMIWHITEALQLLKLEQDFAKVTDGAERRKATQYVWILNWADTEGGETAEGVLHTGRPYATADLAREQAYIIARDYNSDRFVDWGNVEDVNDLEAVIDKLLKEGEWQHESEFRDGVPMVFDEFHTDEYKEHYNNTWWCGVDSMVFTLHREEVKTA